MMIPICNIHFILTLTPPWLQVNVTKYFDFVILDVWRVVVCVRFSSETTRPISPMMIPINWGNNVDVQHTLHFDLDPYMTAGQGHKILQFCEFRCLTGTVVVLCSLLLQNYLADFSNADTNLPREQCRFATYILHLTFAPPWLQVNVTKYFNFINLDVWRVVVCVRFSSETTPPNSPMLIPIYRGNNVDLQNILNFDLHPFMTAGQGYEILQFCEFRLLP